MPTEQRRFSRYQVSQLSELKGEIYPTGDEEHLITVGQGGCGFYGIKRSPHLVPQKRVQCAFLLEGVLEQPIEVQGHLVYAIPIQLGDSKVIYYGVQFIRPHQVRLAGLLHKLEEYFRDGRVGMA